MRVEQVSRIGQSLADRFSHLLLRCSGSAEFTSDGLQSTRLDFEGARLLEAGHGGTNCHRVASMRLEQESLEVRRDLDVHRRRGCRLDGAHFVATGLQGASKDVVVVRGDHQPLDGQPHALGDVAGKDVTEVSSRNRKGDLPVRTAER